MFLIIWSNYSINVRRLRYIHELLICLIINYLLYQRIQVDYLIEFNYSSKFTPNTNIKIIETQEILFF